MISLTLTSISISIQTSFVYAKGQTFSLFAKANHSFPLPNVPSSPLQGGSGITPNAPDNSNPNISPNAGGGNKIPDGSITTSKLADGAVTNSKIANNAVNSSQIQDSSVTPSKISFLTFHSIPSGHDGFATITGSSFINITGSDLSDIKPSSIVIVNINTGSSDFGVQVAYGGCEVINRFDHGFTLLCPHFSFPTPLPESARLDIAVLNPR